MAGRIFRGGLCADLQEEQYEAWDDTTTACVHDLTTIEYVIGPDKYGGWDGMLFFYKVSKEK